MATKSVKVKQRDPNEVTKLQIILTTNGTAIEFGPNPNVADRVKIPDGTRLEVMDTPINGAGNPAQPVFFIADTTANGNFRRYFIKVEDTVAA